MDYQIKMDIPAFAGLHMGGSLYEASGNRCYLTNAGEFVIHDGTMECITDGTNYLNVGSQHLQWERGGVRTNLNELLAKHLVYSGMTPIIGSQLPFHLMKANPTAVGRFRPMLKIYTFPMLPTTVSASNLTYQAEVASNGKAAFKFRWESQGLSSERAIVELWLDKQSLLPLRRLVIESGGSPLEETYVFRVNQALPKSLFDPWSVIHRHKIEGSIKDAESPNALLLKACERSDLRSAEEALKKGANPNYQGDNPYRPSYTPLMHAVDAGNLELLKLLCSKGADVNGSMPGGLTALSLANRLEFKAGAEYLVQHGASPTNVTPYPFPKPKIQ